MPLRLTSAWISRSASRAAESGTGVGGPAASAASAAARPARRPKVIVSISELPPRRFEPWTETQATSPAA